MEFLLILSAMLSAVTGAFAGTRVPEGRSPEAEATIGARLVVAIAQEEAVPSGTSLPEDAPASAEAISPPDFALADPIPLYADRLIE